MTQKTLKLNYEMAKFRVCVDAIGEGGLVGGRVFGLRLKEAVTFSDLNTLVLKLEDVMDTQNFPQSFQRKRRFAASKHSAGAANAAAEKAAADTRPYMDEATVSGAAGAVCTFILHIMSRRSACWQGVVMFPDGSGRRNFASVSEFFDFVGALSAESFA